MDGETNGETPPPPPRTENLDVTAHFQIHWKFFWLTSCTGMSGIVARISSCHPFCHFLIWFSFVVCVV